MALEKELSLIIPAYQSYQSLLKTIPDLLTTFPDAEIIITNDGSLDETSKIKDLFKEQIIYLENKTNKGKGFSIREGILQATGKFIIFTDADLPYGTEGIQVVLKELQKSHQVVISKREKFNDNFIKAIGRFVFDLVFKPFLGITILDTQAGLKGFSQRVAKKLFAYSFINRFAIDLEILLLCQKFKYPVTIVPVQQKNPSPTQLSILDIIYIFIDILRIKFHHYAIH